MMRKLLTVSMIALCVWGIAEAKSDKKIKKNEPIVMTINGHDIPRSEFMYFYEKNNSSEQVEQKSFDEYVDLFVNFRLKVEEALSRGIDTTQTYITELEGYRKQLAEPYLNDANWVENAVSEVIERSTTEVHASHILFSCEENASPDKVAEARAKMLDCRRQLEAGASFDSLARVLSEDPSARQNAGDLGYFTVMQMVFPFEEAAFTTEVGQVSEVRSQFGFHLIKVHDKRASKGEVVPAHIMLNYTPSTTATQKAALKMKADSIYREITVNKRSFEEVCAAESEDVYTAKAGGKYNWIGSNARFPKEWIDAAFSLEVGEVSKPFETQFGIHIMTVVDKRSAMPDTEEHRAQLRQHIERDESRKAASMRRQQNKWMQEEGLAFNEKVRTQVVAVLSDTALSADVLQERLGKIKKPLVSYAKENRSALDFGRWLIGRYGANSYHLSDTEDSFDAWSRELITEFEDAHLAEKNVEFANLYKEYHDGILLFEVATKEVWDKAEKDEEGLKSFFETNRAKYNYETPRFKGAFIECADDPILVAKLKKIYAESNGYQEAADRVRAEVLTDSVLTPDPKHPRFHIVHGIYSPGDNATVDRDCLHIDGVEVTPKASMPIQFTSGKVLATGPEEVADVRNAVVADYQNELEKIWVAKLREKFSVSLNQAELNKLKSEQ